MKISRLRVEQFRQFREPFEIPDFESGINLFCGPNESGKSTLVQAIRAAFFERHTSGSLGELAPWGDSSAAPQVELEFEAAGERYRLIKRFLKQKRCDLHRGSEHLEGENAESHIAEILGFEYASRGRSRSEHWGIP